MVALTELVHQLKIYTQQEAPFSSAPNSDTLSWWHALSESSDAHCVEQTRGQRQTGRNDLPGRVREVA